MGGGGGGLVGGFIVITVFWLWLWLRLGLGCDNSTFICNVETMFRCLRNVWVVLQCWNVNAMFGYLCNVGLLM